MRGGSITNNWSNPIPVCRSASRRIPDAPRSNASRVASTTTAPLADGDYIMLVKVFDDTSGYADYVFEETVRIYS